MAYKKPKVRIIGRGNGNKYQLPSGLITDIGSSAEPQTKEAIIDRKAGYSDVQTKNASSLPIKRAVPTEEELTGETIRRIKMKKKRTGK
jgi:hypothetical protein